MTVKQKIEYAYKVGGLEVALKVAEDELRYSDLKEKIKILRIAYNVSEKRGIININLPEAFEEILSKLQ